MRLTHYWRPVDLVEDRPKEVLVDVDGPLAAFDQAAIDIINSLRPGKNYTVDDIKTWEVFESIEADDPDIRQQVYARIKARGGCLGIPVVAGAQEGIEKLRSIATVIACTSPFYGSETWVHERSNWLYQHFKIKTADIVHTKHKFRIAGDILVDDKVEHIEAWQARFPCGKALLWGTPGNRSVTHLHRITTWEEVYLELL